VRRLPRRIARRRAGDALAAEEFDRHNPEPVKPGGPCALCGKPEDDHYAGMCDDWRPYTPKKAAPWKIDGEFDAGLER